MGCDRSRLWRRNPRCVDALVSFLLSETVPVSFLLHPKVIVRTNTDWCNGYVAVVWFTVDTRSQRKPNMTETPKQVHTNHTLSKKSIDQLEQIMLARSPTNTVLRRMRRLPERSQRTVDKPKAISMLGPQLASRTARV